MRLANWPRIQAPHKAERHTRSKIGSLAQANFSRAVLEAFPPPMMRHTVDRQSGEGQRRLRLPCKGVARGADAAFSLSASCLSIGWRIRLPFDSLFRRVAARAGTPRYPGSKLPAEDLSGKIFSQIRLPTRRAPHLCCGAGLHVTPQPPVAVPSGILSRRLRVELIFHALR